MTTIRLFLLLLCGLFTQAPAFAAPIPIEFVPSDQTVTLGGQVSVDVVIGPSVDVVAAYDMFVNWDSSLLSLSSVVFGPALGGGLTDEVPGTGTVNVSELSLLFDFTGFQDGSPFTAFTLSFNTLGIGTSALTLAGNIDGQQSPFNFLGGEFGQALQAAPGAGSITITQAVAEPSALLLLILGFAGLGAMRIPARR